LRNVAEEYPTCYMRPLMGKGLGTSPVHFSLNLALQSRPTSTVSQPAVYEHIFVHQDHSAKSNDQTPSEHYLF